MSIKNKIKQFFVRNLRKHYESSGLKEKLDRLERLEMENIWACVFNNTITDSSFLVYKSFSPGRWAASYSFLYLLYRVLTDFQPKNIIEFGLGQTSKITIQYVKKYSANLFIIEHDSAWVKAFEKSVPNDFDVNKYVDYLDLKTNVIEELPHYEYDKIDEYLDSKEHPFDLIIIDGPFGSKHQSRNQILNIIDHNLLDQSFVILFDDYNRQGEKETVDILVKKLEEKNIDYKKGVYYGEKDQCIIVSSDLSFLASV